MKREESKETQWYRIGTGDKNQISKGPDKVNMKWKCVTQVREGPQQEAD